MAKYTQTNRPMAVTTPLGVDVLLLAGFSGHEGISQLYNYQLDVLAETVNAGQVKFDALLGKEVTVELELAGSASPREKKCYFSGICSRVSQGARDDPFTHFRLEVVPKLWLLSRRARSRIFQQMTVPDIIKKIFRENAIDKVSWKTQGQFEPRDYCVQYRETDFNFVSRLLEEEGIFYFFKHSDGAHELILADDPSAHEDIQAPSSVQFEPSGGAFVHDADLVHTWEKVQEIRSGKYTLRDYTFEKPDDDYRASKTIQPTVTAGAVEHPLAIADNDGFELYDFPGEYAQRFDGIDPGGGDQSDELGKIHQDNTRTATIRMQEEAASSLVVHGTGQCRQFSAGRKFTLRDHYNGDGAYVLTAVQHSARQHGTYATVGAGEFTYHNSFACIPEGLPYRPARTTPKPVVHGTQTAVVVGQPGDEIFTDKYGRVKVQFRWDRDGKKDAKSSCWVRVATLWSGAQWGSIQIPRVGQEVVVAFEEGDADRPIIVGTVYNAENMPPYKLPDNKTQSGIKSRSTLQGQAANFNELRFEDKKDHEDIYFHAEKNFHRVVENDDHLKVGFSKQSKGNQTIDIFNNQALTVGTPDADDGSQTITIYNNRTETVKTGNESVTIEQGNRAVLINMGNDSLTIKMGNQTTKLDMGQSTTEAMQSIELKVGQSSVKLDQMGVTIKGMMIQVEGQIQTEIKGMMTQISGDAMLQAKGGITMIN